MYQELIDAIQAALPGYHFEITIFPSGGIIDAEPCDECGTTVGASSSWRYKKGPLRTMDESVAALKVKLLSTGKIYQI